MEIKIGEKYVNKTWRFLLPCLRGHGTTFAKKFNSIYKLAVGIHDSLLDGSAISNDRNLYIMIDKKTEEQKVKEFMDFIVYQDYFVADYCPDSDILKTRRHMIVLKMPKRFHNAYDKFLEGKYSEMFTPDEVKVLFANDERKPEKDILQRNSSALKEFVNKVNKEFDVNIKCNNFKDEIEEQEWQQFKSGEWEMPLKKKEEIFNCEDNQRVFFNEKLDKIWL